MSQSIISERGRLGLPNVGNSCYLNSTVQCLAGTQELLKYFSQIVTLANGQSIKKYKTHQLTNKTVKNNKTNSKKVLVDEWYNLLGQLWSDPEQIKRVNPIPFYRLIGQVANESKTAISISGDQNDFQEFLILIMDSLHDALSYETQMNIVGEEHTKMDKLSKAAYQNFIKHFEKDYSIFVKLFNGQINTLTIGECGHESNIFDPIKFFPLVVPASQTPLKLEDLFQNYVSESQLKESESHDERWFCDKCNGKVNATSKNSIWDLPQYLIISLGRYQYFPRLCKINTPIVYPIENLDMSPYYTGFKNQSLKYNLYAVSNHFGSQSGGHYTAFRKNPNNKWYHFNDESVQEVSDLNSLVHTGAYCLFYERI